MKSIDDKIIFANAVVGQGIFNSNINVTLAVFLWSPSEDGKVAEPDPAIVARLRLDIPCARQLVMKLAALLDAIDNPPKPAVTNGAGDEDEAKATVN